MATASHRATSLTPQGIDRAFAAAAADPEVLRLHHFETDLRPPAEALEAARRCAALATSNTYLPTIGTEALRDAVSAHLLRRNGQIYDPSQEVVVTAGGLEAVFDALLATVEPGSEVIVPDPTYTGLLNRIRLAGATPVCVPFVVGDGEWRLDLNRLRDAVSERTRAMLIANPSMPTGAVLTEAEWSAVASLCIRHDLWLIYDAAMEAIVFDGRPVLHPLAHPGMRDRTLIVGSASKEFRLIGARVGWTAGPAEIMQWVTRVAVNAGSGAPATSQAAAAAALTSGDAVVADAVAEWQSRRDVLAGQLEAFGVVPAAGGWSMVLDVSQFGLTSGEAVKRLMDRAKVAATSQKLSGVAHGETLIRLAFGAEPAERLRRVGRAVRDTLAT